MFILIYNQPDHHLLPLPLPPPLPPANLTSQPNYIFWLGSQVPKWQKSGNTKSTGAVRGGGQSGGGEGGYCPVFVSPFVLSSNNYSIDFIVTTNTYLTSIVPEDKYFLWSTRHSNLLTPPPSQLNSQQSKLRTVFSLSPLNLYVRISSILFLWFILKFIFKKWPSMVEH